MTLTDNPSSKALKDFLAESEEIINQLSLDLITLSDSAERGECDPDVVNSIFRSAHSLKGLAGMFGFADIAELAHNLENLLDRLRLGKIPINHLTTSILFDSMELLGALVRSAGTDGSKPADISAAVERINACINTPGDGSGTASIESLGLPEKVLHALTEYEEHRLRENLLKGRSIYSISVSYGLDTFDRELGALFDALKKGGEVISTLPSSSGDMETSISFEILFGSSHETSAVSLICNNADIVITRLGPHVNEGLPSCHTLQSAALSVKVSPGNSSPIDEPVLTAKSLSRSMRVDMGKLDELMNIVGELILSHSTIADLSARLRSHGFSGLAMELTKAAKGLERKLNELQKGVMEIRMTPVGQLFEKMARIVRKISMDQGKKVELKIFGADTELDKVIIEDISDPLMHIIRNSIDHGIETPEERVRQGKSESGVIRLSSYQKGNHVVIEVEDDGKGIDIEKVKRKAVEAGYVGEGGDLSDKEAIDLLFLPGLSTAEQVSEVSGRGVGMDVVRNNIQALSGMVDIESEAGRGTRVVITLPITLAIIKVLLISASGRSYAVPITSVQETLSLESRHIITVERKEVMRLRDMTLPLLRLSRFFGADDSSGSMDCYYVIVVGLAEKRVGILVDDLLGQQDIVIKPLGDTFKGVRGVSGAADLGDQRTILVLDTGGIISEAVRNGA
ncbi:MAG: cheA40H [Geobacteraceae bacterium]|nr:cheA40H [Geobacteraceae bacterium]